MHTQFNSFTQLLRRYPLPLLGNVLGLAAALASFLIISIEVKFDLTFDRHIPDGDRIVLLTSQIDSTTSWSDCCRPVADNLLSLSPHIEQVAYSYSRFIRHGRLHDTETSFVTTLMSEHYFDLFRFDWLACDTTMFADPQAIFLPESMARQIYGTVDLIGKGANSNNSIRIGGIYRDFPANSTLQNNVYRYMGNENLHEESAWQYRCFLKLTDMKECPSIEQLIFEQRMSQFAIMEGVRLVPLLSLHFRQDLHLDSDPSVPARSTPEHSYILLFVTLVIIVIACINFTNLYAALCPLRIRSINTQKVLGATRGELFRSLVGESTVVCLCAWLLALGLVLLADRFGIGELQQAAIAPYAYPDLLIISLAVAVIMGIASGTYPALYATSFQPALVLKGNFGLSPKGKQLRNLLIGIQFVSAFVLFINVLNLYQQGDYMRNSELGYNQNRLICISTQTIHETTAYVDGLKRLSVTEEVAISQDRLSSIESGSMMWGRTLADGKNISFHCIPVSDNFLRTTGITVIEGRDFLPTDRNSYIFNETARKSFEGLCLGSSINGESVVGFCEDVKFGDLHNEMAPMAFKLINTPEYKDWDWQDYIIVRTREGVTIDDALKSIREYTDSLMPNSAHEVLSQYDVMDLMYKKDGNQLKSLLIFCALAIFICLTGVFGLVVFECEYRRKEIGVRKVMGAVTGDILAMLCRRYIWILTVSFIVAAPVAWYTVDKWLQNFAYRTEILTWTFVVPLLAITAITLLTFCIQSYRTACADPMDSLRSE